MANDPVDLIDGLTNSDDVSKSEMRSELKSVLRFFADANAVRACDLTGRARIMIGTAFYKKDTASVLPDDGDSVVIDYAGTHWVKIDISSGITEDSTPVWTGLHQWGDYDVVTPAHNATSQDALTALFLRGDDSNPVTEGNRPSLYYQRVDESTGPDDASNLMYLHYSYFKRLSGGTGWIHVNTNLLEDYSASGASQSVAVGGVAHSKDNAAVWGLYAEAHAWTTDSNAQAIEANAYNWSGTDFLYNEADPTGVKFTNGGWFIGFGDNLNSFAVGIAAGSADAMWGAGLYFAPESITTYGIDIQASPPTIIRFKNGASTGGLGITPGGIGIDTGDFLFGSGAHQGAIHLRDNRIVAGDNGTSYLQWVSADNIWKIACNGTVAAQFDAGGMFALDLRLPNGALKMLDTNASHLLNFAVGSDLTANRTLTFTTGDANRTLSILTNTTLNGGSLREALAADRTYYCDWTNGSDSNTGLSSGVGNAFKTIQKAWDVLLTLDLNGHTVTIELAASQTFTSGLSITVPPVGGNVILKGNSGSIISTAGHAIYLSARTTLTVQGLEVRSSGAAGIYADAGGSKIVLGSGMTFGACLTFHTYAVNGGYIQLSANYTIAGAAIYHHSADGNGIILSGGSLTITNSGTNAFTIFANAQSGGQIITASNTYTGGTITGQRYNVSLNGVINTFGGGGSYWPGNSAGATATGGQYA